jgi:hypothetical protein
MLALIMMPLNLPLLVMFMVTVLLVSVFFTNLA